jgi:hypothetical protein
MRAFGSNMSYKSNLFAFHINEDLLVSDTDDEQLEPKGQLYSTAWSGTRWSSSSWSRDVNFSYRVFFGNLYNTSYHIADAFVTNRYSSAPFNI